jgi:hypothetical protein
MGFRAEGQRGGLTSKKGSRAGSHADRIGTDSCLTYTPERRRREHLAGGRPRRSTGAWPWGRERVRDVRRCGDPPEDVAPTTLGPCHARAEGFDPHATDITRCAWRSRAE